MRIFSFYNRQPGDDSGISEEDIILPAPDACSDRIVRICRYGLYFNVLFALAGILFFSSKG